MKIELIEKSQTLSELSIVLEKSDYIDKYNSELNKSRKTAHLKGFRKGKTPMSAIKKIFGVKILTEILDNKLESAINDYIRDHELNTLFTPIPSARQTDYHFKSNDLQDFEFIFDLFIIPDFELKGLSLAEEYEQFTVDVNESFVHDEFEKKRLEFGSKEEIEEGIEPMDFVSIKIVEHQAPEGREVYEEELMFLPESLTEDYRNIIIGQSLGFEFDLNINQLEEDIEEAYIKKNFLLDAPEDITEEFKGVVTRISRLTPAALEQEFFDRAFGTDLAHSKEQALEILEIQLIGYYTRHSKGILHHKMFKKLLELNELDIPKVYITRWLSEYNEDISLEDVEEAYDAIEKELKWKIIKDKIIEQENIKITTEEFRHALSLHVDAHIMKTFGKLDFELSQYVDYLMQDEQFVEKKYLELLKDKVLDTALSLVNLKTKIVSIEEYIGMYMDYSETFDDQKRSQEDLQK